MAPGRGTRRWFHYSTHGQKRPTSTANDGPLRGGAAAHASAGALWGDPVAVALKPAALEDGICPIKTYLESELELRFPESQLALYPVFFGALRKALRALANQSLESGSPAQLSDADRLLEELFPESKWGEHPHFELYRGEARRTLQAFASAFRPDHGATLLDPELEVIPSGSGIPVRLDLIARYVDSTRTEMAVGFRPESLAGKVNKKSGALPWTGIKDHAQIPFVLTWQENQNARAFVFSGADARIYPLEWHSRKGGMATALEKVVARHRALAAKDYSTDVEPFKCDRCRVRVTCPYWTGAIQ